VLGISRGRLSARRQNRQRRPGSAEGDFYTPCGIGVATTAVYVADTFNHRVQVFDRSLEYLGAFGREGRGDGEFSYPVGVYVSDGHTFIA
jgi:tripartite motif-containing protein 71